MTAERRLGVAGAVVDGRLVRGDVAIADGAVAGLGLSRPGTGIAIPGLVDLQVNGFAGVDLLSAGVEAWREMGRSLLRAGVTAYQPTLITAAEDAMSAALRRVEPARASEGPGARILGAHLEGPFLSPSRMGTHPPEHRCDPDPELLGRLLAAGPVSMVTLAPELPGALDLIDRLVDRGVVVSLGHSEATAAQAAAAFERGARALTHVFNAMAPLRARQPGLAGAGLARAGVTVSCIADGVHLADEVLGLLFAAAGDRVALVSDAIAAAGMPEGEYRLGDARVHLRDGRATRDDGTLAGSVGTILDGIRRVTALGVPLERAVAAATAVPARLLGRSDVGTIAAGARADVVVLDDALSIRRVLLDGSEVEQAGA